MPTTPGCAPREKRGPRWRSLSRQTSVRHLRRVRHVKAGPVEARRRGTSTTHITHQHKSWANSDDSRGARAQGRPSNRKSEHHLRVHRALRPRLPRLVLRTGPSGCDTKQNKTTVRAICHLELRNLYLDSASIKKTLTDCRSARSRARKS